MRHEGEAVAMTRMPRTSVGVILFVLVAFIFAAQFAQHGTDWGAYWISMNLDCSVISALLFGVPILLLCERFISRAGFEAPTRLAAYLLVITGLTFLDSAPRPGVDVILGRPLTDATVLSERPFTTFAGSGGRYTYAQFRIEPTAFEKLMADAGFRFVEDDSIGTQPDLDLQRRFRYPITGVIHWRKYRRAWTSDIDSSELLYDLDGRVAHAQRIQG